MLWAQDGVLQCGEQQGHRGAVPTTLGPHGAPDRQTDSRGRSQHHPLRTQRGTRSRLVLNADEARPSPCTPTLTRKEEIKIGELGWAMGHQGGGKKEKAWAGSEEPSQGSCFLVRRLDRCAPGPTVQTQEGRRGHWGTSGRG